MEVLNTTASEEPTFDLRLSVSEIRLIRAVIGPTFDGVVTRPRCMEHNDGFALYAALGKLIRDVSWPVGYALSPNGALLKFDFDDQ